MAYHHQSSAMCSVVCDDSRSEVLIVSTSSIRPNTITLAPPNAVSPTSSTAGRSATIASQASRAPTTTPTDTTTHDHSTPSAAITVAPRAKPTVAIASAIETSKYK